MTSYSRKAWDNAKSFCKSQHSSGLVTWDTEEKWLDVRSILGKDGKDQWGYTALYNKDRNVCTSTADCSYKLVRKEHEKLQSLKFNLINIIYQNLSILTELETK